MQIQNASLLSSGRKCSAFVTEFIQNGASIQVPVANLSLQEWSTMVKSIYFALFLIYFWCGSVIRFKLFTPPSTLSGYIEPFSCGIISELEFAVWLILCSHSGLHHQQSHRLFTYFPQSRKKNNTETRWRGRWYTWPVWPAWIQGIRLKIMLWGSLLEWFDRRRNTDSQSKWSCLTRWTQRSLVLNLISTLRYRLSVMPTSNREHFLKFTSIP